MYIDVDLRDKYGIFYSTILLFRFFLFVMLGSVFCLYPILGLQFLMLTNSFFSILYFKINPHFANLRKIQQYFHESILMTGAYHLAVYSNAYVLKSQMYAGYSFYFFLVPLLVIYNFQPAGKDLVLLLKKQVIKCQKKKSGELLSPKKPYCRQQW